MAKKADAAERCSVRLACQAFSISETCYRYQTKLKDENALIVTTGTCQPQMDSLFQVNSQFPRAA
jgi:hypothetical protein